MAQYGRRTPTDTFETIGTELDSPARFAFVITPGAENLYTSTRGIYVGGSGNVFCRPSGESNNVTTAHANVFFYNVVGGTILPVRVDKVWENNDNKAAENTTATFMVGLY
jgi:hypothetical protein